MINVLLSSLFSSDPSLIDLSTVDVNIVFDGDSLWAGQAASESQYIGKRVKEWFDTRAKTVTFNSFGVGGQTILGMLSDQSSQILSLVDGNKLNILFYQCESINGILNSGFTKEDNHSNCKLYASNGKNAGFNYVFGAIDFYPRIPYNQVYWEPRLDEQHDFYELIKSDIGVIDYLVDIRLNTNIGGARYQNQDANYFNDSVHLIDAGYDEYSNEIINQSLIKYFK